MLTVGAALPLPRLLHPKPHRAVLARWWRCYTGQNPALHEWVSKANVVTTAAAGKHRAMQLSVHTTSEHTKLVVINQAQKIMHLIQRKHMQKHGLAVSAAPCNSLCCAKRTKKGCLWVFYKTHVLKAVRLFGSLLFAPQGKGDVTMISHAQSHSGLLKPLQLRCPPPSPTLCLAPAMGYRWPTVMASICMNGLSTLRAAARATA